MLDFLRRNSSSFIVQLIFVAIVVVFVFWGMGTGAPPRQTVAEVNGKPISDSSFVQAYRNEVYRQQRFGELDQADYERIKAEVIQELITREVLLQEAARQGIRVSDHELRQEIMKMPAFHDDNGNFSADKYKELLKNIAMDAPRFEQGLREDLVVQRLQELVRRAVVVDPDEVREAYRRANERVNLEFVRVRAEDFRDEVDLSDARVDEFLAANLPRVQQYYDSRYDAEFNKPRQVRTSRILLRVSDDDPEDVRNKVQAKAEELARRAAAEDFATLARRYSEDHTARRGGDAGWIDIRRKSAPWNEEAVQQALASLQAGQISGVVRTSLGYEIYKAEEVREAQLITFDEAKRDIAKRLIQEEEAPKLARAFAEKLAGPFGRGEDVSALLAERALQIEETGEFGWTGDRVPRIGQSEELVTAAFALRTPGRGPEQVFEVPGAAVAIRLKARQEADMSAFEQEKDQVAELLLMRKQGDAVRAWVDALRAQAEVKVYDVQI